MGGFVGIVVGLAIAGFGFLVIRNPITLARLSMTLALLSPGLKSYYQRQLLNGTQRIQLRILRIFGASLSLFGQVIATSAMGVMLKIQALDRISMGLLILMGLLFFGAWGFGLVFSICQLIRGRTMNWFGLWKCETLLGPIDVFPSVTLAMHKESKMFMFGFCLLEAVIICAALYYR